MSEQRTDKSWREYRREQAWALKQQGWKQKDIAAALGVSEGAVSQWMGRGRLGELAARPAPGKPPKLSQADKAAWVEMVQAGAVAAGFEGEGWTAGRVRQVIAERFGVHYSAQKKAKREGYTIVFADESGFRLLPMRVRTWARRGQTPRLSVPLSHKHLSVMGGITLDGRLLTWQLDHACRGEDCVYFLRHLLRQVAGKVLVIWDGLPAHRSQVVKDFLRAEAADRLWLVALPPYAPDLNPIETLWNYLKRFELANLCTRSLDELHCHLRRAIERLRHRRHIILSCFHHQFRYL